MIINLTFAELEIVKGFDMTFVCGPVGYVKKAGIPKNRRKEIGKIIGWFLDNFFVPVREENKALLKGENRRAELLAISKDFDLPFRWIQRIYELLDVGLLTLAQDEGIYYDYGKIEPREGDLMFLYSGKEADAAAHKAIHVGIVAEVKDDGIVTIEGNVGPVCWREYEYAKTNQILGFARLPENPDYISLPGDRGRITFSGVLPKDAVIKVVPVPLEELADYELPEGRILFAFETQVFVNGERIKTRNAVSVRIETPGIPQEGLQVIHIREDAQGRIIENWPVEQLTVSKDAVSYTEFSLARVIAVATEP